MKLSPSFLVSFLVLMGSFSFGQMHDYSFKRPLTGARPVWNRLVVPDDIFQHVAPDFADVRIFGISENNDTVEAPYLLRVHYGHNARQEFSFKVINKTRINNKHYFTFETTDRAQINHIKLQFEQKNFDWLVQLEGSNNQKEWFTILEQYRILSIQNENTNYQYTALSFPEAQFQFYRLSIACPETPDLNAAFLSRQVHTPSTYKNYELKKFEIVHNKQSKQTEIDVELYMPVPVSFVQLEVGNNFDYYRTISISCVNDSIKTEKGWTFSYLNLASGIINSFEKNEFTFSSTIARKFKIVIENQDNQPLNISSISVKGFEHELVTRLDENLRYYLVYGDASAKQPNYDLVYFTDQMPDDLNTLVVGSEIPITKPEPSYQEPLFVNRAWLWVILFAIVLILGWFTLKMMKKA